MQTMILISGIVEEGKKRGKDLGFPTANILLTQDIPQGIYISQVKIDSGKKWLPSLTFIGNAKTFEEKDVIAETYILDFSEDIYGKTIEIKLLQKIRDNQKFETIEGLKEQMKKDELAARSFFGKLS